MGWKVYCACSLEEAKKADRDLEKKREAFLESHADEVMEDRWFCDYTSKVPSAESLSAQAGDTLTARVRERLKTVTLSWMVENSPEEMAQDPFQTLMLYWLLKHFPHAVVNVDGLLRTAEETMDEAESCLTGVFRKAAGVRSADQHTPQAIEVATACDEPGEGPAMFSERVIAAFYLAQGDMERSAELKCAIDRMAPLTRKALHLICAEGALPDDEIAQKLAIQAPQWDIQRRRIESILKELELL